MSITAYTGLPGSGKSYEVANGPIKRALDKGRPVWTNVPVTDPRARVCTPTDAEGKHWYLDAPPGALIVIDECWRYWPAGMKADQIDEEIKEFFAMHRHRTDAGNETEIALVTQDLAQIAAFVRNLVDKTYRMRKLNAIGWNKKYRVDVYSGAVTGQRPPEAQHVSGWISTYKPEGFLTYKSHTQGEAAEAAPADTRGSPWKRPAILAIPLSLVAIIALPFIMGDSTTAAVKAEPVPVSTRERSDRVTPAPPTPQPAPVHQPPPPAPAPRDDDESKRWIVLGVIEKEDGTGLALLESATGRRRIPLDQCERTQTEWICRVDGQLVAMWTGNGMMRMAQASSYNNFVGQ